MEKTKKIKIGIIGIGMVGTPLMRWFLAKGWERGKDFFCYDADPKKNYLDDIKSANIIFICVPTPPNPDGSCNTSVVESVVARFSGSEKVLVIKSTVPPGTTRTLAEKYRCIILFNPEFLTESQAWEDFIRPDRQIVASANEQARKWTTVILNLLPIGSFQSPGVEGTYGFHEVNSTEAELAKYVGNTFGALKVSFFNVFCDYCNLLNDVNYENVRLLVTHDRRIGGAWTDVNHGDYRGYAGFCFPKDSNAIIAFGNVLLGAMTLEGNHKRTKVLEKGIKLLEAMRVYNDTLLKSQGFAVEEVSVHDTEVEKKIKAKKERNK